MIAETIYNDIKEALTKGLPFASQELQELCKQLIQYKIIEHSIGVGISLLIVLGIAITLYILSKKDNHKYMSQAIAACFLIESIPFIFFIVNTYQLIQAIVAPKLYILEYIATQMRG